MQFILHKLIYVFSVICWDTEIFLHLASFIYFLLLTAAVISINEHFMFRIWVAHTLEWRESAVVPAQGSFQLFIPLPEIGNCDILAVFFIHSFLYFVFQRSIRVGIELVIR